MSVPTIIGDATLYRGDCIAVMAALTRADAVICDPPYGNSNHDGDFNARLNEHRGLDNQPIANDGPEEMRKVVDAMLTQAARLLGKEASACCCFCGGGGRHRFLLGLPSAWTEADCSFFIRSFGTNAIPDSAYAIEGSMRC